MKLEPCPNCKTPDHLEVGKGSSNTYRQVYCTACSKFGPLANTAAQARLLWNQRRKAEQAKENPCPRRY
jgi:hypothetical protein